jgi:hypothetical protein
MNSACTAWELVADTFLLNMQRLQNKILRTIGNSGNESLRYGKIHIGATFECLHLALKDVLDVLDN